MYLTWCNTVDGHWRLGDLETELGGIRSIASTTTGDKFPPSQWEYYGDGSWNTDDATLTIESEYLPIILP